MNLNSPSYYFNVEECGYSIENIFDLNNSDSEETCSDSDFDELLSD